MKVNKDRETKSNGNYEFYGFISIYSLLVFFLVTPLLCQLALSFHVFHLV